MPKLLFLSKSFYGILIAWVSIAVGSFGYVEANGGNALYAAIVAAISAFLAALIAGTVHVVVTLINTSRSRREQRQTELDGEVNRWHIFYTEKLAFIDEQLFIESNILRVVRNAKHQLISDVGARDAYIEILKETLRDNNVEFEKMVFRNLAEAFKEEDEQIRQIVEKAMHTIVPRPGNKKVP